MATKSEHREYINSDHWQEFRTKILEERNRCERCELPRWLAEIAYDQDLNVHHRHYRTKGHENPDDVEVLCRRCHDLVTFKRSDLRAPKHATCTNCLAKHWNPRQDLCDICRLFVCDETIRPQIGKRDRNLFSDLWQFLLFAAVNDVYTNIPSGLDVLRQQLEKFEAIYRELWPDGGTNARRDNNV